MMNDRLLVTFFQVQHLQKVLMKKRDPVSHVYFIDEIIKVGTCLCFHIAIGGVIFFLFNVRICCFYLPDIIVNKKSLDLRPFIEGKSQADTLRNCDGDPFPKLQRVIG